MSSEPKPIDARRPFRRINNTAFVPTRRLDGDGAACGCKIQKDLGDIDAKLEQFIKDTRDSILGKTLGQVIDFVRLVLNPSKLGDMLIALIKKEAGDVVAAILTPLIVAAGGVLQLLTLPIRAIVEGVIGPIETAMTAFLKTLGRPLLLRANRLLPQWVPVENGNSNTSVDRRQVIEVEGICTRSFGNPVDLPLINWHTWFNWNVQVTPEPEYARVFSPASDPPNTSGKTATEVSIIKPGTFEIQWDAGAMFGPAEQARFRTKIADRDTPSVDGPMTLDGARVANPEIGSELDTAFIWPMPGMFVWASGRHVYDCSRVTHKANADPKKADVEATPPQMVAMINPARAIATARRQAFQFRENGGSFFVPAIEFMFMASRRGGYINHDNMADEDYIFVIDLPPAPAPAAPYPIANTDKVPHNTIVIRPRLLKNLRFLDRINGKKVDPIIEIIPPADSTKAPQQVRLTIPKGILDGADAYGFTLSLGWHDPALELAKTVVLCEVDVKTLQMRLTDRDNPGKKLRQLFKEQEGDLKKTIADELKKVKITLPIIGDFFPFKDESSPISVFVRDEVIGPALERFIDLLVGLLPTEGREEWLFRIGVNGKWVSFFFEPSNVGPNPRTNPPQAFSANQLTFKFALAKGDELMFSSHGLEFDPVGDMMHAAIPDRTLGFENDEKRPIPWSGIVDPPTKAEHDRQLFVVMRKLMFDTTEGVSKLSLGFDNSPLGLIDPDIAGNRGPSQQNNPTVVQTDFGQTVRAQRLAHFARAIAPEMILVEDTANAPVTLFPVKPDYDLRYDLTVTEQIKPPGT